MYSTLSYFKRGKRLKSISLQYIIEECGYFIVLFPTLNVKKTFIKTVENFKNPINKGLFSAFSLLQNELSCYL